MMMMAMILMTHTTLTTLTTKERRRDSGIRSGAPSPIRDSSFLSDNEYGAAMDRSRRFDEEMHENGTDEDVDVVIQPKGNFWYNPTRDIDRPSDPRSPTTGSSRRRRKPTTFRSGTPRPPPPIEDFYNRLFWYGVDVEEDSSPADKTMFGGTKGKFNGLAFITQGDGIVRRPQSSRKRREREVDWDAPPRLEDDDKDPFYDNDDDPYNRPRQAPRRTSSWQGDTPPYDPPRIMREINDNGTPQRAGRYDTKPRRRTGDRRNTRKDTDWASAKVANWFNDDPMNDVDDAAIEDDEEDHNDSDNERSINKKRKRRNIQSQEKWNLSFLDSFLGLDRDKLERKAVEYNRKMGIGLEDSQRRPTRRPLRRNGYGSPYQGSMDEPVIDHDEILSAPEMTRNEADSGNSIADSAREDVNSDNKSSEAEKVPRKDLSWEERALAMERVPPNDVPAWGPSGELNIDARSKAISDALEDLSEARLNLKNKERIVTGLREDMTLLRVDSELERKRLRVDRRDYREVQERIRQLDRKVEDTSRRLRYALIKVDQAKSELSELEARHWAVLSFYDPNKAEQEIDAALRELENDEPAVRHFVERKVVHNPESGD